MKIDNINIYEKSQKESVSRKMVGVSICDRRADFNIKEALFAGDEDETKKLTNKYGVFQVTPLVLFVMLRMIYNDILTCQNIVAFLARNDVKAYCATSPEALQILERPDVRLWLSVR